MINIPHPDADGTHLLGPSLMLAVHLNPAVLLFTLLWAASPTVSAQALSNQWNQFRGPNGSGVAADSRPPPRLEPAKAAWQTSLPPGKSSPILWGDRIFVTGTQDGRLATICLERDAGKTLWTQPAPETPWQHVHEANSVAASTPCANESVVVAYFGSYGLLCYDHSGQERWQHPLPMPDSMYGVATSPILYHGRVILVLDDDADLPGSQLSRSKVAAFDLATGEAVWETARPYNRGAWSTPMIWQHDSDAELVVLGDGRVTGYDPETGTDRRFVGGFAREPIAVPVAGDATLFVSVSMQGGRGDSRLDAEPFWKALLNFDRNADGQIGRDEITHYFTLPFRPELAAEHPGFGMPLPDDPVRRRQRQHELFDSRDKDGNGIWSKEEFTADMSVGYGRPNLMAIRPGGRGDITDTHVSWKLSSGIPEIPSPVYFDGRLYLVRDGGILTCVNASTGEVVYRERLGAAAQYTASPIVAGGRIYLASSKGIVTVVNAGNSFEVVSQTDLSASVFATPALDPNTLYVRSEHGLLAFR